MGLDARWRQALFVRPGWRAEICHERKAKEGGDGARWVLDTEQWNSNSDGNSDGGSLSLRPPVEEASERREGGGGRRKNLGSEGLMGDRGVVFQVFFHHAVGPPGRGRPERVPATTAGTGSVHGRTGRHSSTPQIGHSNQGGVAGASSYAPPQNKKNTNGTNSTKNQKNRNKNQN